MDEYIGLPDDFRTGGAEMPTKIYNAELDYWHTIEEPSEVAVAEPDTGIEFVLAQAAANADKPDYLRALVDVARAAGRIEVAEYIVAISRGMKAQLSQENAPVPPCTPARKEGDARVWLWAYHNR